MLVSLAQSISVLEPKVSKILIAFRILSGISIVGMMLTVTIDATMRKLVGNAIYGSYDIVSYLLCIFVFSSFIVCQLKNAHFKIDIVTIRFAHKTRFRIDSIGYLLAMIVCWLMAFRLYEFGLGLIDTHATAMELTAIQTYPFAWFGAVCVALLGVQFLFETMQQLHKTKK